MSELLFVPKAHIAGPLPHEIQHYTDFSAGTVPAAARPDAAALVAYLAGELARQPIVMPESSLPAEGATYSMRCPAMMPS